MTVKPCTPEQMAAIEKRRTEDLALDYEIDVAAFWNAHLDGDEHEQ